MKPHPAKATGSVDVRSDGSLKLITHMEADPGALSFARFDFHSILPPEKAEVFHGLPAYLLRHEAGVFVIVVRADTVAGSKLASARGSTLASACSLMQSHRP